MLLIDVRLLVISGIVGLYLLSLTDYSCKLVFINMVNVDNALILKLEKLARLQLSETERSNIRRELESVLAMVEKLEEVDTRGVEPLLHIVEREQSLREDVVENQLSGDDALSNAPEKESPFFKVPKVIERS
jgi:aspartyl-tRNA(Asn)/glutamyl-tRNA(Gln) amidotransferase subunit C